MKDDINICENCGKISRDYNNEIGWIHFDKWGFSILGGRDEKNIANALFYKGNLGMTEGRETELDFCSISCFLKYLFSRFNDSKIKDREGLKAYQKNPKVVDYLNHIETMLKELERWEMK